MIWLKVLLCLLLMAMSELKGQPDRKALWLMLVLCMPRVGSRKTSSLGVLWSWHTLTDFSHWATRALLPTEHQVLDSSVELWAKSTEILVLEFILTLEVANATTIQKGGKHGRAEWTDNAGKAMCYFNPACWAKGYCHQQPNLHSPNPSSFPVK